MKEAMGAIDATRLRAPEQDGQAMLDPTLAEEATWLSQNLSLRGQQHTSIAGTTLQELQVEARSEMVRMAREYTSEYRDVPDLSFHPVDPIILAGHQPQWVHAGVWFKNFVLSGLAQRTNGHGINLLIDNDVVRSTALRVPATNRPENGSDDAPVEKARLEETPMEGLSGEGGVTGGAQAGPASVTSIPFDRPSLPIPFEERPVLDLEQFAAFGRRVHDAIEPLIAEPLLDKLWSKASDAARSTGNLGRTIARLRHQLEERWGLDTCELPLSHVCRTTGFRQFAGHLLTHAEPFRQSHNACLGEYRRVNRVRSHTHPVPPLATHDEYAEVPFWLWTADDPHRRPAFVRMMGRELELTDFHQFRLILPAVSGTASGTVERLAEIEEQGIRLRPRALVTTMYARLVLSDVFIHGIGGAKYDELTDAIISRFLEVEPPKFLVASATFWLPVARPAVTPSDLTRIDQCLRELRYHPELHVQDSPETRDLTARKRSWIARQPSPGQGKLRRQQIERLNDQFQPFLSARRRQLIDERDRLRALLHQAAFLGSREFAFCLFPEDALRDRLARLALLNA